MSTEALLSVVETKRLLVMVGKGGVGRTTASLLLGIALAEREKRVLVATTGHDDRLAWMTGIPCLANQEAKVAKNLFVQRVDPHTCVREYGELITGSRRIASAVFDNGLVHRLLQAVPGLDDFAILGKVWHTAIRSSDYDIVIFDGDASGHMRLNLGVPRAIIDTVTAGPLVQEARDIDQSLGDEKKCAAVLIGVAELWPLTELGETVQSLREKVGLKICATMINRCLPPIFLNDVGRSLVNDARQPTDPAVQILAEMASRARSQLSLLNSWIEGNELFRNSHVRLSRIPLWGRALDGIHEIQHLKTAWFSGD